MTKTIERKSKPRNKGLDKKIVKNGNKFLIKMNSKNLSTTKRKKRKRGCQSVMSKE